MLIFFSFHKSNVYLYGLPVWKKLAYMAIIPVVWFITAWSLIDLVRYVDGHVFSDYAPWLALDIVYIILWFAFSMLLFSTSFQMVLPGLIMLWSAPDEKMKGF